MFDIAEVARRSGVPASTLRYYDEAGLICATGRRGLRRVFGPDVFTRLSLISLGQIAGFSLADIAAMLAGDGPPVLDRAALQARVDEIDLRIRELSALRDSLQHVVVCQAPSHLACPSFRRLMRVALLYNVRRRRRRPDATTAARAASV
ncbi:helix-turn-helix domain-containing protein [Chitinibacteraceae bacterium HSL-7]